MKNIIDASKLLLVGLAMPLALTACPSDDEADDEIAAETDTGDTTDESGTSSSTTDDDTTETTEEESTADTTEESTDTTTGEDPFVFADNPPDEYVRVDRMGMPAVATAVITNKDMYNAANPSEDANADFVPEISMNVTGLHAALDDDLVALMAVPCAPADCLLQAGPLVIPDTLKIDLTMPAGFPNGRMLTDQVVDITLAVVLLDLTVPMQTPATFASIPVNPGANDVEFLMEFPWLAPPN
jgi:hypothetical protein